MLHFWRNFNIIANKSTFRTSKQSQPPNNPQVKMKLKNLSLPLLGLALTLTITSCSKKEYAFFSSSRGGATATAKQQPVEAPVAVVTPAATTPATTPAAQPTINSFESAPVESNTPAPAVTAASAKAAIAEVKKMSFVQKLKLAKELKAEAKRVAEGKEATAAKGGKSQLIALLLVLLVGGLGIHRFYLGYTWQGVVQLLTLGGCCIWTLIDLIRIIIGDLEPQGGPYTTTL
jgi:TM2 domain-containing membrane protein YozV